MRALVLGFMLALFAAVLPARGEEALLSKIEPLTIATEEDAALFTVEIADTEELRSRGLMFRQRLPEDRGMLFDFGKPQPTAMWMKNTYISLDMLFIRADGTIAYIAARTVPQSLEVIGPREPIRAVLELAGGVTAKLGIRAGDRAYHRIFSNGE